MFSSEFYLNNLPVNNGSNYSEQLQDSVSSYLSLLLGNEGYFNPVIKTNFNSELSSLSLSIDEGKPTFIKKINLNNLSSDDSLQIHIIFSDLENEIFRKNLVENKIVAALKYFENLGYPYSSVDTDYILLLSPKGESLVNLSLRFAKGPLCKINEIIVKGNTSTKDYVITRELRIEENALYNQDMLDEIPSQLNRLGYFKPVNQPEFFLEKETSKGILQLELEEISTNNFDGIIGYVPGDQNTSGFFTGYVDIFMRNLFGTGRQAKINWHQESRNTQELELGYLEPWLFGYPINISLGLYQRKEDTLYVQRNLNASVEYLAFKNISASFLFKSESVIPSENSGSLNNVYDSEIISTGLSLKIDTRDDPYSPKKGLLFLNTYTYDSKTINSEELTEQNISENTSLQKISVDLDYYQLLFEHQVVKFSIHGRETRGDFFEYSDLFALGGTRTLRGYREKQFRGNRIFWGNLEYRYLFDQRSFVYTFFDAGYFLRREEILTNTPQLEATKTGFGFGINLETGVGILNVSYALGEGDNFSNGKIHFGIANEF